MFMKFNRNGSISKFIGHLGTTKNNRLGCCKGQY